MVPQPGEPDVAAQAVDGTGRPWSLGSSGRDRPQRMLMGKGGTGSGDRIGGAPLGTPVRSQKGSAGMLQLLGLALISEWKGKS